MGYDRTFLFPESLLAASRASAAAHPFVPWSIREQRGSIWVPDPKIAYDRLSPNGTT